MCLLHLLLKFCFQKVSKVNLLCCSELWIRDSCLLKIQSITVFYTECVISCVSLSFSKVAINFNFTVLQCELQVMLMLATLRLICIYGRWIFHLQYTYIPSRSTNHVPSGFGVCETNDSGPYRWFISLRNKQISLCKCS